MKRDSRRRARAIEALILPAALAMMLAGKGLAAEAQPASEAKAPEYVGAEACLSCHQTHEGFKSNIHAKALPNAKGIEFSRTCEACHGPGSLHMGAGGDRSNPDFNTIINPAKKKPSEASETCMQCHEGGRHMHWKGSPHDMKNVACTSCHSMHAEKVNEGKPPLLKTKGPAESCYQCHAEKKAQIRKSAHMPLVAGKMGCTGCHNPHGSPAERLLAKNNVPETCYQCHQDKRGPFLWDHAPAREGSCSVCHDSHGSHNEKMLVTRSPMLCQRCHVGGRHPATAYGNSPSDLISNRLAYKGCVNCHFQVHGSNHPSGKWLNR